MEESKIIAVAPEHIERGIQKYKGVLDENLDSILRSAGMSYTPYRFLDGRMLLVLPNRSGAFLYPSEEALLTKLDLI